MVPMDTVFNNIHLKFISQKGAIDSHQVVKYLAQLRNREKILLNRECFKIFVGPRIRLKLKWILQWLL